MLFYLNDGWWFINLSYVFRFIEGVGSAASSSCLTALLMDWFPNYKAAMTAFTETFVGFGYLIGQWETRFMLGVTKIDFIFHITKSPGPPLGSVLYQWAGFGPPYYTLGIFILTVTFLLMISIPKERKERISAEVRLFHE